MLPRDHFVSRFLPHQTLMFTQNSADASFFRAVTSAEACSGLNTLGDPVVKVPADANARKKVLPFIYCVKFRRLNYPFCIQ
jgi:hypothetical protein